MGSSPGCGIYQTGVKNEQVGIWLLITRTYFLQLKLCPAEYGLDSELQTNWNPTTKNTLTYGDIQAIEECLTEHHACIAAIVMECLHGLHP